MSETIDYIRLEFPTFPKTLEGNLPGETHDFVQEATKLSSHLQANVSHQPSVHEPEMGNTIWDEALIVHAPRDKSAAIRQQLVTLGFGQNIVEGYAEPLIPIVEKREDTRVLPPRRVAM